MRSFRCPDNAGKDSDGSSVKVEVPVSWPVTARHSLTLSADERTAIANRIDSSIPENACNGPRRPEGLGLGRGSR
ncbi:MAG: hypothetical protein KDE53_36290, partial [Caldilineaceae bacterium]|nr:hypothetical protein [Caldilineaceae bacterium]